MEENTPAADAVRLSLEHGFSRLPVYRKSLDDIVGILYVKDLFALWDTPEKGAGPGEPVHARLRCSCRKPAAPRNCWWILR